MRTRSIGTVAIGIYLAIGVAFGTTRFLSRPCPGETRTEGGEFVTIAGRTFFWGIQLMDTIVRGSRSLSEFVAGSEC